jgi:hypothetical protein
MNLENPDSVLAALKEWGSRLTPPLDDEKYLKRAAEYVLKKSEKVVKKTMAVEVIELAQTICSKFFIDQTGKSYGWIVSDNDGGRPMEVKTEVFKNMLAGEYYQRLGRAANRDAINTAVSAILGMCQAAEKHELSLRCAFENNQIFIDQGDKDWKMWVISENGVKLVPQDRPLFIRKTHMQELENVDITGTLR